MSLFQSKALRSCANASKDFMNPTLWTQYLDKLRSYIQPEIYNDYLEQLSCSQMSLKCWELCLPDNESYHWVESKLYDILLRSLQELLGPEMQIQLSTLADPSKRGQLPLTGGSQLSDVSSHPEESAAFALTRRSGPVPTAMFEQQIGVQAVQEPCHLRADYNFDTFIKGGSNEFAYAAARAVADNPAGAYNPLFLYGGVGLGKTHLMHAIGNAIRQSSNLRVRYMTSEEFTNDLVSAVQSHSMPAFRERIRQNCDLLLLDDVQFIAGKQSTQEEFFHSFNFLQSVNKQIVLSSDRPPQEIKNLEERLKSRFAGGLITDIQSPDFETRLAILRKKATSENINLPDDVAQYMAAKVTSNIRELEGCFKRVKACSEAYKERINMSLVHRVIDPMIKTRALIINTDLIMQRVCAYYGISTQELKGRSRTKPIVRPRQIAMYLSKMHTNLSFPELGRIFDRDHTTIMNGVQQIEKELKKDLALQYDIKRLEAELLS